MNEILLKVGNLELENCNLKKNIQRLEADNQNLAEEIGNREEKYDALKENYKLDTQKSNKIIEKHLAQITYLKYMIAKQQITSNEDITA